MGGIYSYPRQHYREDNLRQTFLKLWPKKRKKKRQIGHISIDSFETNKPGFRSPVSTEGGSRASLKQGDNKQKKRRVTMIEISCLATADKLQKEEEMIPVTLREKRYGGIRDMSSSFFVCVLIETAASSSNVGADHSCELHYSLLLWKMFHSLIEHIQVFEEAKTTLRGVTPFCSEDILSNLVVSINRVECDTSKCSKILW